MSETKKFRVLAIDDSSFFRNAIREELKDDHFELIFAETGEEGLVIVLREKIDLIVLDLELPDISGFEVIEKLKSLVTSSKTPPDVPVIFLTGTDTIKNRMRGFELGAIDFLGKTALAGNLYTAVKNNLFPGSDLEDFKTLIVDDSNVVRMIMKNILCEKGMNVIEAESGQEAIELLNNNLDIDFMIIDKELPNMDGLDVVKHIKKNYPNRQAPILVVSGSPSRDVAIDFFHAGASDYLSKPFIKEEFVARVKSLLGAYRMDHLLRERNDALKEAREFKDKFLAQCSHDMKTPIHQIKGSLSLLTMDKQLEEEDQETIDIINYASDNLLQLVDNILALRKIEFTLDYEKKDVDLKSLMARIVKAFENIALLKKIKIILHVPDRECIVKGDVFAIERLFNNLINNAIKFSNKNSDIDLKVAIINGKCIVAITDYGVGLDINKINGIFEKEITPSTAGTLGEEGTGLGLHICKTICDKHGAQISVESTKEKGTTFTTVWALY